MLLALVQNNVVCGIYQPISDDDAAPILALCQNAIDITLMYPQPQIGWVLIGNQLCLPDGSSAINWRITKLAFRERFTPAELMGIIAASVGTTTEALFCQMMMQNQAIATFIDLSRSDTIAGVETLVSFGLLTSARATAILTTVPIASELYQG